MRAGNEGCRGERWTFIQGSSRIYEILQAPRRGGSNKRRAAHPPAYIIRTYTPPAPQAQTQTQESALSSSPQDGRPIITSRDSSLLLPLFLCSFILPINTPVGESAFCVYNATKCKLSGRSLHVSLVEVRAACMYYTIHPTGRSTELPGSFTTCHALTHSAGKLDPRGVNR